MVRPARMGANITGPVTPVSWPTLAAMTQWERPRAVLHYSKPPVGWDGATARPHRHGRDTPDHDEGAKTSLCSSPDRGMHDARSGQTIKDRPPLSLSLGVPTYPRFAVS